MIACFDAYYTAEHSFTVCVGIAAWTAEQPLLSLTASAPPAGDYVSGEFYRRELPGILRLFERLPERPAVVVIDGYVWLEPDRPGLGHHLHRAIHGACPVIGVAKTPFKGSPHAVPVNRGGSAKPLFITAEGMDPVVAAACIRAMAGPYRMPTILTLVDRLSKSPPDADAPVRSAPG